MKGYTQRSQVLRERLYVALKIIVFEQKLSYI